eukprot:scaffold4197_cov115-Cylindrotheca_fusiformis.AAC.4
MGEDVNGIIYNDGIPSLRVQSEAGFIKGFSDDILDEAFPPTAQDAAELEAVEVFVPQDLMAGLDLLEQKEEATRLVHAGLKKRWETRLQVVGRRVLPGRAINGAPDPIVYENSSKGIDHRMGALQQAKVGKFCRQKKIPMTASNKVIQQPRKHY